LSLATIDFLQGLFQPSKAISARWCWSAQPGVELDFGRHGAGEAGLEGADGVIRWRVETRCTLLRRPSTDLNLIVSQQRTRSASRCVQLAQPSRSNNRMAETLLVASRERAASPTWQAK